MAAHTKKLSMKQLSVDEAKANPRELAAEEKNYRAVIQLGNATRWKNFGGGTWKKDESRTKRDKHDKEVAHFDFVPAIHETGPISGRTLNGLISHHNSWIEANATQRPEGQMARQLLVVDFHETDEVPPEFAKALGGTQNMHMLETIVRSIMEPLIEKLTPTK